MAQPGLAARPLILPTHTPLHFANAIRQAADLLRAGGVVALPTETVYGLAANALDAAAVARIFEIKGRPAHNPIIVHVADIVLARACAAQWPGLAEKLATAFWPGPLTLVLPRAEHIPAVVTAGGSTVGIRWPQHPVMEAVIRACGFPLAAPSANPSNQVSPTTAAHVARSLAGRIDLVVDGGPSHIGIESTVLDLTCEPARILRPGMIGLEAIRAVIGEVKMAHGQSDGVRKSPGLLRRHYAPKAPVVICVSVAESAVREIAADHGTQVKAVHVLTFHALPGEGYGRVSVMPNNPTAYARALYAELHFCDEAGAELIIVEAPPPTEEWQSLHDRLRRAAEH